MPPSALSAKAFACHNGGNALEVSLGFCSASLLAHHPSSAFASSLETRRSALDDGADGRCYARCTPAPTHGCKPGTNAHAPTHMHRSALRQEASHTHTHTRERMHAQAPRNHAHRYTHTDTHFPPTLLPNASASEAPHPSTKLMYVGALQAHLRRKRRPPLRHDAQQQMLRVDPDGPQRLRGRRPSSMPTRIFATARPYPCDTNPVVRKSTRHEP